MFTCPPCTYKLIIILLQNNAGHSRKCNLRVRLYYCTTPSDIG